jgi:dipeptidyl aminopeptidase/acylaminoacyl peptidase
MKIPAHISRRGFAITAGLCLTKAFAPGAQSGGGTGIRPLEGSKLEIFPDGSTGQISEFRGADGTTMIPAFVRKPKGTGPSPVVVILHGGAKNIQDTYTKARTDPPAPDFVAAGWAVVTIDYRSTAVPLKFPGGAVVFPPFPPIELKDTLGAIEQIRQLPFIDSKRVGVMGGSHGGYIMSKVLSRSDVRFGIICSPAIFDVIELSRALDRGAELNPHIKMEEINPRIKDKIAEAEQKYGAQIEEIAKHPEAYGYESPMQEAAKVRGAVMIINGLNDTSSPPSVMEVWAAKLRAAGKEVETYMPENAPHGFYFGLHDRVEETRESTKRAVAFVRKHFSSQKNVRAQG